MRHLLPAIAFGLFLSFSAERAAARSSTCTVPLISTCEGCVSKITVTVRPNGSCHVRYILNPAAVQGRAIVLRESPAAVEAAALSSFAIEMTVQRHARRASRAHAPRRASGTGSMHLLPSGGCFVFQNQEFCE